MAGQYDDFIRSMASIEEDKKVWIPPRLESASSSPSDGTFVPVDKNIAVNTVPGQIEVADQATMEAELAKYGMHTEPEIGRAAMLDVSRAGAALRSATADPTSGQLVGGYSDYHWTHFDFRPDVGALIARVQKKFPWLTFANTYFEHPPVYRRKYEIVSFDMWAGGIVNGYYTGYRGKPINSVVDGWAVFNAIFNDAFLPNIYWIIFDGYMWTRGYGWGPAPGGPPDSDPLHRYHIHCSMVL